MYTTNTDTQPNFGSTNSDRFGVKYIGKQYEDHLIESIREYYPMDVDWTGGL